MVPCCCFLRKLETPEQKLILLRVVDLWHQKSLIGPARPKPWIPNFVKEEDVEILGPTIKHKSKDDAVSIEGTKFEPIDLTSGSNKLWKDTRLKIATTDQKRTKRVKVKQEITE